MDSHLRRQLRARAHALSPVVIVGAGGLSGGVLQEIDRALKTHELIKIRVAGADRMSRDALLAEICSGTGAQPVQHIGKILVVHRENRDKPDMPPPAREEKPSGARPRKAPQKRRAGARTFALPGAPRPAIRAGRSGARRPGRRAR